MLNKLRLPMFVLLGLLSTTLLAQQQPAPCSEPEYRQFDFWIGEWEVFNPAGEKVGENRIERVLNGCALHENWRSAKSAFTGNSYNTYDESRKLWHQTWVDNSGQLLLLQGGLDKAGRMVLQGERAARGGEGKVMDRITWTPNADGSVRQFWEASKDGGRSWDVVFDGLYRKLPAEK